MPGVQIGSIFGVVRNAYAFDREAGGSSGGTGAAVAANLGMIGFGTDTGGSIRDPAAFNYLVGLRPSLGLRWAMSAGGPCQHKALLACNKCCWPLFCFCMSADRG